jgi:hypothetical protein
MSQGDYLKHKINSHILKSQTELPSVLNSRLYTEFVRYQIANSITNTNNAHQQLEPQQKQTVFGMEKSVASCPEYILCENTQNRPYRTTSTTMPFSCNRPFMKPIRPLYVKDPTNSKTECDCALNRTSSNPCKCATSQ